MAPSQTDGAVRKPETYVCNHCSNNSPLPVLICFKCSEGVRSSGVPVMTPYCSAQCLQTDEARHEPLCHLKNERKRLYRAGNLLQRVFLCWRELLFDMKIKSVEHSGTLVFFFEDQYNEDEGPLFEFPVNLFKSDEHAKAVLTYAACNDSMAFTLDLAKKALEGLTKSREEAYVEVDEYRYRATRHYPSGEMEFPEYKHVVLNITSNNDEQYCIDLAGAQFGEYEAVTPFKNGQTKYGGDLYKTQEHGDEEQYRSEVLRGEHDHDLPPTMDLRVWQVQGEALKRMNRTIEEFEEQRGQSIKNLLCLSDKHYHRGEDMLFNKIANCLRAFVRDYKAGKIEIAQHLRERPVDYERQRKEAEEDDDETMRQLRAMGFSGTIHTLGKNLF